MSLSTLPSPEAVQTAVEGDGEGFRVLKFGGTSVASAEALRELVTIVADSRRRGPTVVVASAIRGVTDELMLACAGAPDPDRIAALVGRLRRRHLEGLAGWLSEASLEALSGRLQYELDRLARALAAGPRLHEVLAAGERLSVIRLAACLHHRGLTAELIDGTEVLALASDGCVHRHRLEAGLERLAVAARRAGSVAVVPGFIAADHYGRTVTLGRGASDLSATALAHLLAADRVEIWTDTPGILSADPRFVLGARTLPRLHPEEATALARYGARVLHPEALRPLVSGVASVRVLSTLQRHHPGTEIDAVSCDLTEGPFGGVAKSVTVLDLATDDVRPDLPAIVAALTTRPAAEQALQRLTECLQREGLPVGATRIEAAGPSSLVVVQTIRGGVEQALPKIHQALCEGPRSRPADEVLHHRDRREGARVGTG